MTSYKALFTVLSLALLATLPANATTLPTPVMTPPPPQATTLLLPTVQLNPCDTAIDNHLCTIINGPTPTPVNTNIPIPPSNGALIPTFIDAPSSWTPVQFNLGGPCVWQYTGPKPLSLGNPKPPKPDPIVIAPGQPDSVGFPPLQLVNGICYRTDIGYIPKPTPTPGVIYLNPPLPPLP
jgi:hypothetical protein